ncbi:hypothetical protein BLOT_008213 [Blomia tropicalis]|nr:hypothetical protein BLOT_008213 [Blomia tropicalis]
MCELFATSQCLHNLIEGSQMMRKCAKSCYIKNANMEKGEEIRIYYEKHGGKECASRTTMNDLFEEDVKNRPFMHEVAKLETNIKLFYNGKTYSLINTN